MENDVKSQDTATVQPSAVNAEALYIHLALSDPEVVAAVSEHPVGLARNEFVASCVKIGVLALRATKGAIDGESIRREGERLVEQLNSRLNSYRDLLEQNLGNTLSNYFDPATGLFSVRVEKLTKDDGELAGLMKTQVVDTQRQLTQTFEQFIGENSAFLKLLSPTDSNQLLIAMKQTVDGVMQASSTSILSQFSLDEPGSALSRLVRDLTATHGNLTTALSDRMGVMIAEFSLDKPDSALSRLVGQVEKAQQSITNEFSLDSADSALSRLKSEFTTQFQTLITSQQTFQTEVVGMLSAIGARKEAQAKSTTHGMVFEEDVGNCLKGIGLPAGDIIEDCGSTTGFIRASKVGDFVVTISPDSVAAGAKIVVEAKESGSYTLASTLEEADEARRNRGANISLFVHSRKTAPAEIKESLQKYGNDIIVIWDSQDPTSDVALRAGYLTAKALSVRAAMKSSKEAASFTKIDKSIEIIRKQLEGFAEITTSGQTIVNGGTKVLERARIMKEQLERQMEILSEEISLVKTEDGAVDIA